MLTCTSRLALPGAQAPLRRPTFQDAFRTAQALHASNTLPIALNMSKLSALVPEKPTGVSFDHFKAYHGIHGQIRAPPVRCPELEALYVELISLGRTTSEEHSLFRIRQTFSEDDFARFTQHVVQPLAFEKISCKEWSEKPIDIKKHPKRCPDAAVAYVRMIKWIKNYKRKGIWDFVRADKARVFRPTPGVCPARLAVASVPTGVARGILNFLVQRALNFIKNSPNFAHLRAMPRYEHIEKSLYTALLRNLNTRTPETSPLYFMIDRICDTVEGHYAFLQKLRAQHKDKIREYCDFPEGKELKKLPYMVQSNIAVSQSIFRDFYLDVLNKHIRSLAALSVQEAREEAE